MLKHICRYTWLLANNALSKYDAVQSQRKETKTPIMTSKQMRHLTKKHKASDGGKTVKRLD
jgi:hypothetical protein